MMATEFCPHCHQPMPGRIVAGVRLPAVKARLFHFIETHPGQYARDLADHFDVSIHTIRSHIVQINDVLINTPIRVKGGQFTGYHVLDR